MLTVEPANVFLLLLDLDVIRNHVCEFCVDASLLKVALQESLQVLVQVLEWRASIEALSGPVLLGSLGVRKIGLRKVRDLLDLEETILCDRLDQNGTVSGLLDGHVNARREARLEVTVQGVIFTIGGGDTVLSVLSNAAAGLVSGLVTTLILHLVVKGSVIKIVLFAQVLKVGNGESETDPMNACLIRSNNTKKKKILE